MLVKSSRWHVQFDDHRGIRRRLIGFTDRNATNELATNIQRLINCRGSGHPVDGPLHRWIEQLPTTMRRQLLKFDLIDNRRLMADTPIAELVALFVNHLEANARSARYIRGTRSQLTRIIDDCDIQYFSDFDRAKVEAFLNRLRNQGLGARTYNAYLKTGKAFCKWMVESGYAAQSPLVTLRTINEQVDRRRERRALSVEEIRRLLKTTARSDETHGMTGQERYLLYRLAIETGLRANEIRSLTRASFDLDACTVTVVAGSSKRRRKDIQIISQSLAAELEPFLATKVPAAKAFGGRYQALTVNTADVLKKDLAEAGIPYEDELGRVFDFHSLRGQCATLLARRGVHPKIAQTIMRHSDINLTMNVYTLTDRAQKASAVTSLSDLFSPSQTGVPERKTGTDDKD
jgi:integrase